MEKTAWAIKDTSSFGNRLGELLYDEWEPFAVTRNFQTDMCKVWLRKIVRVEVKGEDKE